MLPREDKEVNMEEINLFSRRDFLGKASAALGAGFSLWAGGCESCSQQINNRPTRKNIQELSLSPPDPIITTYTNAVTAMKALPTSDPRSWQAQANIHFNKCTHSNWLWLPWHRTYLVYFERICRKLTGDNNFALPYWNWTTHPAVPDAFWNTSSSLFDSNRGVTQTDQADASYIGASVIQNILNETNFELFASAAPLTSDLHSGGLPTTGMLEGTPHNNIHNFVGGCCGDMAAFHSPLDPVFWTHHCMLDCLWTHWNNDLGNANTNDPAWTNFSITDFVDENKNPVTVEVATTILFPLFSYQYEPCSLVQATGQKIPRNRQALEKFLRAGAPSKLEFVRRFETREPLTLEAGKAGTRTIKLETGALHDALEGGPHNRAVLTIGDVDIPEKRDFFVRVFVGKPGALADTSIDDPRYAGSFGFFFDETVRMSHDAGAGRPKTGFLVDLTSTLRKLNQAGSLPPDQLDVSFVAVPYGRRESTGHLTLQRLELGVARF
jgi:tyrosinase